MKKLLVVAAALTVVAPAAMASKARMTALANSRQILDIQTAFDRPYQFMALGSMATMEWGSADTKTLPDPVAATPGDFTVANPHAEGGFLMKHDDMAYGAYLGRRSDAFNEAITFAGLTPDMMPEQNPLNLYYATKTGDWTWGVTVKYSNAKDELAGATAADTAEASSSGLSLGATNGTWEVEVTQGITGKSTYTTAAAKYEIESKGMTQVGVGYKINEKMDVYGKYGMVKADINDNGTSSTYDKKAYELGFVNTVVNAEGTNFFYGIAYNSGKIEDAREVSSLPVWMGIEADATSWMVMRASVKQNFVLNETKSLVAGATNGKKYDVDSINFNAGMGIKLGKGMVDALFGTAKAGHLSFSDGSTDKFLTSVAYTYNF